MNCGYSGAYYSNGYWLSRAPSRSRDAEIALAYFCEVYNLVGADNDRRRINTKRLVELKRRYSVGLEDRLLLDSWRITEPWKQMKISSIFSINSQSSQVVVSPAEFDNADKPM